MRSILSIHESAHHIRRHIFTYYSKKVIILLFTVNLYTRYHIISIMPESTTLPELLLGSRTRVRILTHLLSVEQGMTRHALAKEIGGGVGPVYEQVDRFIALGVLEERDNSNIFIDRSFPFMDTLTDLVLAGVDYFDHPDVILGRIDRLFGDDYYVTGYLAACQNGFPIDFEQNTVMISILGDNIHVKRYVRALNDATQMNISYFVVGSIGRDIRRMNIYGTRIWMASLERGLVDCLEQGECPIYPVILLLLQNRDVLDWGRLLEILKVSTHKKTFGTVARTLMELGLDVPQEVKIALPNTKDPDVVKAVKDAYQTLMGG